MAEEPDLFDLAEARRRRDAGMERAANHADHVIGRWREKAWEKTCEFLSAHGENTFMGEDIRLFAHGRGLETPPDNRAWGGIIMRAAKRGLITRVGFGPTKSKNCHANPKSVWKPTRQA
jgi:hypothetical protein